MRLTLCVCVLTTGKPQRSSTFSVSDSVVTLHVRLTLVSRTKHRHFSIYSLIDVKWLLQHESFCSVWCDSATLISSALTLVREQSL